MSIIIVVGVSLLLPFTLTFVRFFGRVVYKLGTCE